MNSPINHLEFNLSPRSRVHSISTRKGYLLRSAGISCARQLARSKSASHIKLELGKHPIVQGLKGLGLEKMVAYVYTPQYQSILSPALESFAV